MAVIRQGQIILPEGIPRLINIGDIPAWVLRLTTNDTYRLDVTDYSQYGTADDPDGGVFRLNTEIIAGKVPDLFYWGQIGNQSGFNPTAYISKGLFADMNEFLENDPEFGRESFVPSVINAVEASDGGLYELPMEFTIYAVACARSDISLDRWTFDEFLREIELHESADMVFGPGMIEQGLLLIMLSNNWDEYIDWENSSCDFESEAFLKLLEFCAGQNGDINADELPNEAIAAGRQLLVTNVVSNVQSIQTFKALFQDEITFIGVPTTKGTGNAVMLTRSVSIYKDSLYKNACWEFIRGFYSKDHQLNSQNFLPVNAEAMEERLAYPEK
jgi:ABC-type glycerol-3-phosphate transport system substrate-binding protein